MKHAASALAVVVLALAAGCGDRPDPAGTERSAAEVRSSGEEVEAEIRRLEQMEVQAVLARDRTTLARLWDAQFVVHNPASQIVVAKPDPVDRPVMQQARTAFTRDVEHVTVRDNVVISMGSETVVPAGDLPRAGEPVKRRYTNVWMRVDGAWKLIARHANEVRDPG